VRTVNEECLLAKAQSAAAVLKVFLCAFAPLREKNLPKIERLICMKLVRARTGSTHSLILRVVTTTDPALVLDLRVIKSEKGEVRSYE
jgi:hypothetical protein